MPILHITILKLRTLAEAAEGQCLPHSVDKDPSYISIEDNRNCRSIQISAHFPAQFIQVEFCGLVPVHYASLIFDFH